MKKPFVFVYLPKTGSTPLLTHLGEHLVWNEGIVFLGPWGDRQRHRQGRPDVSVWSEAKRKQIRVLTGTGVDMSSYRVAGGVEGRYFTVLRDPADRLVAEYNALRDRGEDPPDFWAWHRDRRVNQMTRHFRELFGVETADEIAEHLQGFWYLTTTDHLHEDAPGMLEKMGVPGAWSPADTEIDLDDVSTTESGEIDLTDLHREDRLVVTDELRERVHAQHPKDRRLYKLALKRRDARRRRFGWG